MNALRTTSALVFCTAFLGLATAAGGGTWKHVKGTSFSIDFPQDPQVLHQMREHTRAGTLKVTDYVLVIPGHVVYALEDVHAPSGFQPSDQNGGALPSYMAVWSKANLCEIVSTSNTTMQGYPALIVMLRNKQRGFVGRSFAVQTSDHIIVVAAVSMPSEVNSPVLSQFLNSFKVN